MSFSRACRRRCYWLLLFCATLCAGQQAKDPVRVWEDSTVIPTSVEGLPDLNPPFDLFNTTWRSTRGVSPILRFCNIAAGCMDRAAPGGSAMKVRLSLLVLPLGLALVRTSSFADSGWFWQNPLPQGNTLTSVVVLNSQTVVAVGGRGTIIRSMDADILIGLNLSGYQ